jgi:hypothetical protein
LFLAGGVTLDAVNETGEMKNGRSAIKNGRCNNGHFRGALIGLATLPPCFGGERFSRSIAPRSTGASDQRRSSCNVAGQEAANGSTLFPNTAIEPSIAVDPTDFEKVLVGHQQDRWNDGGARGLVGVLSRIDDLDDWRNTIPPGVTQCTGGSFVRASDPWVAYANDGTAFFFSLTTDPAAGTPFASSRTGMLMSRSTDHGHSWQSPTALIDETTTLALNDKNSVTRRSSAVGVREEAQAFSVRIDGPLIFNKSSSTSLLQHVFARPEGDDRWSLPRLLPRG